MWFGTSEGLNRYDGFTFTIFKSSPSDSNSLSSNYIKTISEDQEGYLWIGTQDGLNHIHPITGKVKRYFVDSTRSKNANIITSLFIDTISVPENRREEKVLWVGTEENGLYKLTLDGENVHRQHFKHSPNDVYSIGNNTVYSIYRDTQDHLWIGTNDNTLHLFLPSTNSFRRSVLDTNFNLNCGVRTLFTDSKNNIWMTVINRGVYQISLEHAEKSEEDVRVKFIPIQANLPGKDLPLYFPSSIVEDNEGNILVSYVWNGIHKFQPNNNGTYTITHLYHEANNSKSISSNQILSLFIDRNNILWAGDEGYGINKARLQNKFSLYQQSLRDTTSLRSKSIRGIYETSDGTLLVGGYSELMTFDRKKGIIKEQYRSRNFPETGQKNIVNVYSIAPDPILGDSILWLGTEGFGLVRYTISDNSFETFMPKANDSTSLVHSIVKSLYPDDNGILWIGTVGGLQSLDVKNLKTPKFISYKHDANNSKSMSSNVVTCIYKSSSGIVWVATNDAGVNVMHPSRPNEFMHFVHNQNDSTSIGSNNVKTIYEDKNGRIWFGTAGGGLNLLLPDGKSFKRFLEEDGLPNNVIYGILEDSSGNLWLSTNKGISRFTPSTNEFWNFLESDGLQNNEFNTGSYYKCKHGEMFFGGINGLNAFFPENIQRNSHIPPVHITSIKIFDKEVSQERLLNSPLSLSYDEDNLEFEYIALDYSAPERNLYKYRMEGLDTHWVDAGNRRFVSYAHLSPGEYTFSVMGSNNDGVWNEQPAAISFVIHPPYWGTWWFLMLGLLFFISAGPLVYYRRVRQLKKIHKLQQDFSKQLLESQENERKRIAAELHDSIGQNMLVMKNKSGLGKETNDVDKKQKYFDDISDIVLKTVKELQTISYNLRPYELDRIGLTEAINAMFSTVKESATFQLLFAVDNIDSFFEKDLEIQMYRIVQEGMNNILKHSQATEVAITIKKKEDFVLLLMQDNGIGFDVLSKQKLTSEHHGFGLSGLEERIHLLGGTMELQSEIGSGTTLRIELPFAHH